jgi:nanoRNase/pAp phosphatase (c-di-AMP/oligoRNAs hydrolase)
VTAERLNLLLDALRDVQSVLILTHNDPDPDAIAGAVALRHLIERCLGIHCEITYKGLIGRAENKALVRELGDPLHPLWPSDLEQKAAIALVDTQPGAGNNALPPGRKATVVFDHHPVYEEACAARLVEAAFVDLRPEMGAISTMMLEYLLAAEIEPPPPLATALFYGIKTDTRGLSRGASQADVDAYFYLQQRVDLEMLYAIEQAQVPPEYFQVLVAALRAARRYDHLLVAYVNQMDYPDLVAELADLLLRLEGIRWALCMGVYDEILMLSVRTRLAEGAAQLIRSIVGPQGTAGGHGSLAGGQISLEGADPDQLARTVTQRALYHLGITADKLGPGGELGERLIVGPPAPHCAPLPAPV